MKSAKRYAVVLLTGIAVSGSAYAQSNAVNWSAFSSGFAQGARVNSSVRSVVIPMAGRGTTGNSQVATGFLANPDIHGPVSAVSEKESAIPATYSLSQNYPNPFNPETEISFMLPARTTQAGGQASGFTSLRVYDLLGRVVATLVDGVLPAGRYTAKWSAGTAASGVYLLRLSAGDFRATRKMVLMR